MKAHIEHTILIEASVKKVWQGFTDFENLSQWSPTICNISPNISVNKKFKVDLNVPDGPKMKMKPKLLVFDENRELRWKGKLFFGGLFDGEHYFRLEPIDANSTRFVQGEFFSGILVGVLRKMIYGSVSDSFVLFNEALKKRVEEMK